MEMIKFSNLAFNELSIGERVFVHHEAYEKKSSRTAYKLEWNHLTQDYDYMAGALWFYIGKNEPCKSLS